MDKPLVSICMIAYNHENYIEDALKGVLEQKVDFPVELVISNDASTDQTHKLISRFLKEYSGNYIVKYINHLENLGMMKNFSFAIGQCSGKYIAVCEGDDYWTTPLKLQRQLSFLEAHENCSFCFHKARIEQAGSFDKKIVFPLQVPRKILNASQFFNLETIPTCSVMFRNMELRSIANLSHKNGDFLLYCELYQHGKAGFLDEVMAVYRKHEKGVSFQHEARSYLFQRIKELKTEQRFFKDPTVKNEIGILYKRHILRYFQLYWESIPISRKYYLKKELYLNSSFRHTLVNRFKRRLRKRIESFLDKSD